MSSRVSSLAPLHRGPVKVEQEKIKNKIINENKTCEEHRTINDVGLEAQKKRKPAKYIWFQIPVLRTIVGIAKKVEK